MKPFSERIKSFPADQFIDWLCLACVDVRQVRTEEDAQDEINNIRDAVTERLSALEVRVKELETEQAQHDEQIAAMEGKFKLAQAGLRSKTDRCDKAEARVKELEESRDQWKANAKEFNKSANKLDIELARLKAQEPVGYFIQWDEGDEETGPEMAWCECSKKNGKPLYAEPRPAVLPQEVIDRVIPAIDPEGLDETLHYCEHAIYSDRERIRKQLSEYFGCQPHQKEGENES